MTIFLKLTLPVILELVTAPSVILAAVMALSAILAVYISPSLILAAVTALSAILAVEIEPAAKSSADIIPSSIDFEFILLIAIVVLSIIYTIYSSVSVDGL